MLDEPGRDTSKFDTIMPTVVRPVTRETFMIGSDNGDVSYVRGCLRVFWEKFCSQIVKIVITTVKIGKIIDKKYRYEQIFLSINQVSYHSSLSVKILVNLNNLITKIFLTTQIKKMIPTFRVFVHLLENYRSLK